MLKVDLSKAETFLKQDEFTRAKKHAQEAFKNVNKAGDTAGTMLGWRRILAEPNDAVLEQINTIAEELRRKVDVLIVCGIGGSYLGGKALIDALNPFFKTKDSTKVIFAGHNISGAFLEDLIGFLETPKADGMPKQAAVNVISKSGTTLETMLSFRILREWMHENYPETASDRIICTTGKHGGVLNQLADRFNYRRLFIPDDIGGRYSVLTPVGLLPAAAAGIDIHSLFYEAVSAYNQLETHPDELLNYAAARYLFEQYDKTVDVISSFEPDLNGLCLWMQQLLGESEGKERRGLFPVVAQYSDDLHSLGQFMQQGRSCMMETFIEVESEKQSTAIQKSEEDLDQLNYLSGQSFHQINQKALQATREAHFEGDVPCVTVSIKQKNEQSIGEFFYFYELFTAVYCTMLGVNPFNQPGVENYKSKMYNILEEK